MTPPKIKSRGSRDFPKNIISKETEIINTNFEERGGSLWQMKC
jgi:hypothetical protein